MEPEEQSDAVLTLIRLPLEEQSDLGPRCFYRDVLKGPADDLTLQMTFSGD